MTNEQLSAHKRLLRKLTVRTVEKAQINKTLSTHEYRRPVSVWGIRYESISQAAQAMGFTEKTIRRWANSGEAARWEDDDTND